MKAKILIVGKVSEQLVATFRSPSEAFQCAALLQGLTNDPNLLYYVEHKGKRTGADSFSRVFPFLNKEQQGRITRLVENCK